jgi:hypothetical protein
MASGAVLLIVATLVVRWESASGGEHKRYLWIATALAIVAALSIGAGLLIWMNRQS